MKVHTHMHYCNENILISDLSTSKLLDCLLYVRIVESIIHHTASELQIGTNVLAWTLSKEKIKEMY